MAIHRNVSAHLKRCRVAARRRFLARQLDLSCAAVGVVAGPRARGKTWACGSKGASNHSRPARERRQRRRGSFDRPSPALVHSRCSGRRVLQTRSAAPRARAPCGGRAADLEASRAPFGSARNDVTAALAVVVALAQARRMTCNTCWEVKYAGFRCVGTIVSSSRDRRPQ